MLLVRSTCSLKRSHFMMTWGRRCFGSLPVGIFVDLDNVLPLSQTRKGIASYLSPLLAFTEMTGPMQRLNVFANPHTQTWIDEEDMMDPSSLEWSMDDFHTGHDMNGMLRCGVCGQKMKLTKKDRARGWSDMDKLDKHMRMLHDREQEKRQTWRKQGRKVDRHKFAKYEAAQVGLFRQPARRVVGPPKPITNDLFRLLKVFGAKCHSVSDVDTTLKKEARGWMKALNKSNDVETHGLHGALVVVSEDGDFADLLLEARKKNLLAVSIAQYGTTQQTNKLRSAADIVLSDEFETGLDYLHNKFGDADYHLYPKPMTPVGSQFLREKLLEAEGVEAGNTPRRPHATAPSEEPIQ